jgi:hypothetical protein
MQVRSATAHHFEDLVLCVTPKWRQPTQQNIQDDPQAPHVCFVAVVLAQHLWSNIVRRSYQVPEALVVLEEHT